MKTIALVLVCFLLLVCVVVVVVVVAVRRKWKPDHWKRRGNVQWWLCEGCRSDSDVAAAEHQGSSGLPDTDLCLREAIPLRSSNIVDNSIYFSQNETSLNSTGD